MPKKTTRRRACEGARPVSASRRSDDQPPTADTSQGESVSIKPREEQERVVLGELEALVDDPELGDLGKLLGEQGAEPCRHLVTYVHQVREVSRDLRIVRPKKGDRTGRHVARIL